MSDSAVPLPSEARAARAALFVLLAAAAALALACSRNAGPPAPQGEIAGGEPQTAASGAAAHGGAPPVALEAPRPQAAAPGEAAPAPAASGPRLGAAGVSWSAPGRWEVGAPRPMRVATYRIPAASGDPEDGECGVFYFGAGQGGGIDANLERWLAQFVQEDGQPLGEAARRDKRDIRGLPVTLVDVSGTYLFSPTPMSPDKTPKPGYRMLGAIVEAPEGNVFFKLTAPRATAEAAAGELETLLRSLDRG